VLLCGYELDKALEEMLAGDIADES